MENNKHHSLTYCNELNVIPMPKLKAKEMDFYMKILYEIKANEKREFRLNVSEFFKEIRSTNSDKVLFKMFEAFADKVLIHNIKIKEPQKFTAFVCFEKCEWDLDTNEIIITAQKDFYELLMDKEKPYTRLDLEEYWDLSSEYAKRLYPYLMQFRSTGVLFMKWDDFKEKLHIPKIYQTSDIDKRVLNPLIKDLTKEHNLFSGNRVIFKGLTYEKIYKWGRGRGGKVIDIIKFTWDTDTAERDIKKITQHSKNIAKNWIFLQGHCYKYKKTHETFDKIGYFTLGSYHDKRPNGDIEVQFISWDTRKTHLVTFKDEITLKKFFNDCDYCGALSSDDDEPTTRDPEKMAKLLAAAFGNTIIKN